MRLKLTRWRLLWCGLAMLGVLVSANACASWYYSFEQKFARSRPALEAYAALVMGSDRTKPTPMAPTWLGAFQTGKVERLPDGFLVFCDHGHWLDQNGLAYSTRPLSDIVNGRDYFGHIEGNWYTVFRN